MKRPERRNRNIGTKLSGFKHRNDMIIPESIQDRFGNFTRYYERVAPDQIAQVEIGSHRLTILYETPKPGHSYGCTPKDVAHLLRYLSGNQLVNRPSSFLSGGGLSALPKLGVLRALA